MSKHFIILSVFLSCLFVLGGCDVVDKDNRFIEVPKVSAEKTLLFEDYTGQLCIFCPQGAIVAQNLKESYKENFVLVSIHAGALAIPPFATETAKEYNTYFNIETNPTAVIDRKVISDKFKDEWANLVEKHIKEKAVVDIKLEASYNSETRDIAIVSKLRRIEGNADLKLQLWITEDNIVARQLTTTGYDNNYVHNHVFRDVVNGTWGEEVIVTFDEEKKVNTAYKLNEQWKAENINIVGFLYNASDREVLQAAEIKLIKE